MHYFLKTRSGFHRAAIRSLSSPTSQLLGRCVYFVVVSIVIAAACNHAIAQTGVSYIVNTDDNTVVVTNGFDAVAGPNFQPTIQVGSKPVGVATNSKFAYISNSGDNTVSVIDTGTNVVVQTLQVGRNPTGVAANEAFAYVTNSDDGTVSIIDVNNGNTVLPTTLRVGKTPVAVAIAPAPNLSVLVANFGDNTVTVISGNTVVGDPIQVGKQPSGIAVTTESAGEFAYVTNAGDNTVSVLILPNTPAGAVTVQPNPFAVGLTPTGIAVHSPLLFIADSASTNPVAVSVFDSSVTTNANAPTEEPFSPLSLGNQTTPKGIAITNDGLAVFVTAAGTNNAAVVSGFDTPPPAVGTILTGKNPNGVAVTPNNPAVCIFGSIAVNNVPTYQCPSGSSTVCDPVPTLVVPSGATVNAIVQCSSSGSQGANFDTMTLSFGQGTNCALSGGTPGAGPCQAQNTTGIGGGTTFPASGVFTIQGTGKSPSSTGSAALRALVGANCTLIMPSLAQVNQPVSASLSCTAPLNDHLSATLNWGDGATSAATGTGAGSTPVLLPFLPTHAYANTGSATASASVTDDTEESTAAVNPASVSVTISTTVVPPTCTFSATPTTVQVSAAVTASMTCNARTGDMLNATVNWGDDTTSPSSATADTTGSAVLPFPSHSFLNPGVVTIAASVIDATTSLAGNVTPPSVQVTVTPTTSTPTVTPNQSSVPVAAGGSTSVDLVLSGGAPNGVFTFACLGLPAGATCTFSPASLTLDASGTGSVTVTVATTGFSAQMSNPSMQGLTFLLASCFVTLAVTFVSFERKYVRTARSSASTLTALLFFTILLVNAGCSNSSVSRTNTACATCTPSGTYQITVVATSLKPALQAKTVFTLTVGP